MTDTITTRPVSGKLALGIMFAPHLFSWFTLREGHSTKARVISFVWLAAVMGSMITDHTTHQPVKTTQSAPVQYETECMRKASSAIENAVMHGATQDQAIGVYTRTRAICRANGGEDW